MTGRHPDREDLRITTDLCDLLGIDLPIVLAPFGPWEEVELAAAVSNAGGLGSVGTAVRTIDELRAQWQRLRELTDRPFAINHTGRPFNAEAFDATLDAAPAAISFHMGVPAELIARARDRGIRWLQTVSDPQAAEVAIAAGADVLIAQGHEAGGNGGWIATLVLVPSVVDVAGDVPVLAAGGIADGRGIAAALALGAQGAVLGTRFLATTEMSIDRSWKERIVAAAATDAVKVPQQRARDATVQPAPARRPERPAGLAHAAGRATRDRPLLGRPVSRRPTARRRGASRRRSRPAAVHRPVSRARARHRPGGRAGSPARRRDRRRPAPGCAAHRRPPA